MTTRQVPQRLRSAAMNPGPGFRIRLEFERCDDEVHSRLSRFETPDISDQLNRLYALDSGIRHLSGGLERLCGPVCTVKLFPGDNLMVHKALDVVRPGDVVAIDAGGSRMNAVLGDIICTKARHRGIAGFVVDGLIRDLPAIQELDFPVWARGATSIGPLHRGPGEINYPIACGGRVLNPGDVLVADAAGVVAVPREIAPDLVERLEAQRAGNEAYLEAVRRGEFSNRWADEILAEGACLVIRGPGADVSDTTGGENDAQTEIPALAG